MTECAETILLPPTNPSAHEQEEHGTMTPLSYVTETYRSTEEPSDGVVLSNSNVSSHCFPRNSFSSFCETKKDSPSMPLHTSCGTSSHKLNSPMLMSSNTRQFCGPTHSQNAPVLYTSVITSKEMAAYEACNFKDVKGVYKNCRGIWAAQWTDERGQRHTKYFNPKYYPTEAEARREAFKFKVHIAREVELKGGVQKRRSCTTVVPRPSPLQINDALLQQSYVQNRSRRAYRNKFSKAVELQRMLEGVELEKNNYELNMDVYHSPPYVNSNGYDTRLPNSSGNSNGYDTRLPNTSGNSNDMGRLHGLLYQDYMIMNERQQADNNFLSFPSQQNSVLLHPLVVSNNPSTHEYGSQNRRFEYNYDGLHREVHEPNFVGTNDELNSLGRSQVSVNGQRSLQNSNGPLLYSTPAYDPVYFSGATSSLDGSDNNSSLPFCLSQNIQPNSTFQFSDDSSVIGSSLTVSPSSAPSQNTQLCACGCGVLALAPNRYAAHHHGISTHVVPNLNYLFLQHSQQYDSGVCIPNVSNYSNVAGKQFEMLVSSQNIKEQLITIPKQENDETTGMETMKEPVFPVEHEECHDLKNNVLKSCSLSEAMMASNSAIKLKVESVEENENTALSSLETNPVYTLHPYTSDKMFTTHGKTPLDQESSDSSTPQVKRLKTNSTGHYQEMKETINSIPCSPYHNTTRESTFFTQQEESQATEETQREKNSTTNFQHVESTMFSSKQNMEEERFANNNSSATSSSHHSVYAEQSTDHKTSFPFAVSWNKCFPLYASYPTQDKFLNGSMDSQSCLNFPHETTENMENRNTLFDTTRDSINRLPHITSDSTDLDVNDIFGLVNNTSLSLLSPEHTQVANASGNGAMKSSPDIHSSTTLTTSPTAASSCDSELLKAVKKDPTNTFDFPSFTDHQATM